MNNVWSSRFSAFACAASMALSACTVGPDFRGVVMPMPAGWPASEAGASSQPSIASAARMTETQWWTAFNDPMLSRLVRGAVANNLDLRIAATRIWQSRDSRSIAAAGLFPTLDTSASAARTRTPIPGGGITANSFQAGFDAAWELDVFGGVRRNIESAEADTQTQLESLRDVQVTLVAEVATNYITLRALQEQLRIAEENLKDDRTNLEVTQKRLAGGFVSKLDVANAQAQVSSTESEIPTIKASIHQTIYALSVLLAAPPDALETDLGSIGPIPSAPASVLIGVPSELLRRRPDIRSAESQIHSATAKIGVATADLFPKFSLTGELALQSDKLTSFSNWNNRFWSVGPSVTWNIFDAGRIRANIELQKDLRDESLLSYEKIVLNALQEVAAALVAFDNEQLRRDSLVRAVEANRQAVDISQQLYKAGQTDFLNVLSAQRSLLSSRQSLAQSQSNIANDLVALYKALGGGWQEPIAATEPAPATQAATAQPPLPSKPSENVTPF